MYYFGVCKNLKNQINKDIDQYKFTTRILDDKIRKYNENMKLNELNTMSIFKNLDNNIMKLKKYPKTTSIIVSTNTNKPLEYFFMDNKLYQNNNFGNNYSLVNGYYFIAISDNKEIINKAWDIQNGEIIELTSYFDGSNNKLIIDSKEYFIDGSIILTSDLKIWIRINNCWISK